MAAMARGDGSKSGKRRRAARGAADMHGMLLRSGLVAIGLGLLVQSIAVVVPQVLEQRAGRFAKGAHAQPQEWRGRLLGSRERVLVDEVQVWPLEGWPPDLRASVLEGAPPPLAMTRLDRAALAAIESSITVTPQASVVVVFVKSSGIPLRCGFVACKASDEGMQVLRGLTIVTGGPRFTGGRVVLPAINVARFGANTLVTVVAAWALVLLPVGLRRIMRRRRRLCERCAFSIAEWQRVCPECGHRTPWSKSPKRPSGA